MYLWPPPEEHKYSTIHNAAKHPPSSQNSSNATTTTLPPRATPPQIGSSLGSINTSLTATCSGCFNANTIAPATSAGSKIFAPLGIP